MKVSILFSESLPVAKYSDMQQALSKHREAQHRLLDRFNQVVRDIVAGYPGHVASEDGQEPEVATGEAMLGKFEPNPPEETGLLSAGMYQTTIGVRIRESAASRFGVWVVLNFEMARDGEGIRVAIDAEDNRNVGSVEARIFASGGMGEVFDAMSDLIMKVLDPAQFD